MSIRRLIKCVLFLVLAGMWTVVVPTQQRSATIEWRYYGGDRGYKRYSPLDQINRDNVGKLKILWRRPAIDAKLTQAFPDLSPSPYFRSTPIILDGVLYAPNAVGLVEAFDGATGKTLWVQEPIEPGLQGVAGQSNRGLDVWGSGSDQRLISIRGPFLYALTPKNGRLFPNFGDLGRVSLKRGGRDHFAALA